MTLYLGGRGQGGRGGSRRRREHTHPQTMSATKGQVRLHFVECLPLPLPDSLQ